MHYVRAYIIYYIDRIRNIHKLINPSTVVVFVSMLNTWVELKYQFETFKKQNTVRSPVVLIVATTDLHQKQIRLILLPASWNG